MQLKTNSLKTPIIKVLFSGECAGDITVAPPLTQFRGTGTGEPVTAKVTLSNITSQKFVVTGIDTGDLPISLQRSAKDAAREQEVTLSFTPPDEPKPFYRGYIYLRTDHATHKSVKVGINAITGRNATKAAGDDK